jgi:hypothetical protein
MLPVPSQPAALEKMQPTERDLCSFDTNGIQAKFQRVFNRTHPRLDFEAVPSHAFNMLPHEVLTCFVGCIRIRAQEALVTGRLRRRACTTTSRFVKQVSVVGHSFTHGFSPSGFSGLVAGCFSDEFVVGGGDLDQEDGMRDENISQW